LKAAPIARNGYHQYTHINQVWDMHMPMMADDTVSGGVLAGTFGLESTAKISSTQPKETEVADGVNGSSEKS
jgi:hypothetical protein